MNVLNLPSSEDESMPQEDRLCRLRALMTIRLALHFARSRVDQSDLLIFACCYQFGAVPIPAGTVDKIGMAIDFNQCIASAHIPYNGLIV